MAIRGMIGRSAPMKRLLTFCAVAIASTAMVGSVAGSAQPLATTFAVTLNADDEVPHCDAATDAARGVAILHVIDAATGVVRYKVVANNLPGDVIAAHIHFAPVGVPGDIVQPLALTPGAENGVVGEGTFTNPTLLAAMQAAPENYYVNVHSTVCPSGVIRGQLG
jgi:hypothetical protein